MTTFANRIFLSAKLDARVYEEVESDTAALSQAMLVVILSSVAAGIGSIQQTGSGGLLLGTVSALLGWFVWAGITYFVGTRMLPEPQTRSNYGEMLRTIGFASSPGMIRIIGVVPGLMNIVFFVAGIWMLVAMVVAVRQALDYQSTLRAVGVCLIGWIVQTLIVFLMLSVGSVLTPGTATG